MRQFSSSGFRLWNLGRSAKLLYTVFCLLTLGGVVSSALYYGDLVGAGQDRNLEVDLRPSTAFFSTQ